MNPPPTAVSTFPHRAPWPGADARASFADPRDKPFLIGGYICLFYSFILAAIWPLEFIPQWAYFPVFGFVIGCLFINYRLFILGWLLSGFLANIGTSEVFVGTGEFVTRDLVFSFGSFRLGVLNLGLANTALVISGIFVARYYLPNLDKALRIFWFPVLAVFFSVLQYMVHPGYFEHTISNRSIIVGLFVILAIGHLPWNETELKRVVRWVLLLIASLSLLYALRFFASYGGRSMYILAMTAIPLACYFYKSKQWKMGLLALILLLVAMHAFVFGTYWFKLMILTSIGAMIILPMVQRHRFLFWFFPIFTVVLPLSTYFVEPAEDLSAIQRHITAGREEKTGIGDLTTFSPSEIWDILLFKYKDERAGIWQSALRHNFYEFSMDTVIPDPSSHFLLYTRSGHVGLWTNGPHHGFLWLLRVYGLLFGVGIFLFINWLIYRSVTSVWRDGPMRWVIQPFLLGFAIIGFHIGDYPLSSSGAFPFMVLLGLGIAMNQLRPPSRLQA